MRKLLFVFALLFTIELNAQLPPSPDSNALLALNQRIDNFVIQQMVSPLDSLYATDFVFSHGSGRIEGKSNWLTTVGRTKYAMRSHDSVRVQQHDNIAVLKGTMYIERLNKEKTVKYRLRYIRVYAYRSGRWQLISHNTTDEVHL